MTFKDITPKAKKPVGNPTFRKVFEKNSHPDDWGVPCIYDYAAWRIWKAAIRFERKRRSQQHSDQR